MAGADSDKAAHKLAAVLEAEKWLEAVVLGRMADHTLDVLLSSADILPAVHLDMAMCPC